LQLAIDQNQRLSLRTQLFRKKSTQRGPVVPAQVPLPPRMLPSAGMKKKAERLKEKLGKMFPDVKLETKKDERSIIDRVLQPRLNKFGDYVQLEGMDYSNDYVDRNAALNGMRLPKLEEEKFRLEYVTNINCIGNIGKN
jgi:hypothetical protein